MWNFGYFKKIHVQDERRQYSLFREKGPEAFITSEKCQISSTHQTLNL